MQKPQKTPLRLFKKKHLDDKLSPMRIPASPMMKRLGYGTGIAVYLLGSARKVRNGSPWAIKKCLKDKTDKTYSKRLAEEATILRQLSHPNIVGFRSYTAADDGRYNLAMEACTTSLGNLLEDRVESNLGPLEVSKILTVGTDISSALKYLHTEVMLMHGDMKSFNILVKGDFAICKLCDFGVSVPIKEDGLLDFEKNVAVEYTGTELWNAPEIFEEDATLVSVKSEIFSFGLVFYECIALCPPHTLTPATKKSLNFDNLDDEEEEEEFDEEEIEDEELDYMVGTRPLFSEDMKLSEDYNQILEVFFICTDENPEKRPTSSDLVEMFAEIKSVE